MMLSFLIPFLVCCALSVAAPIPPDVWESAFAFNNDAELFKLYFSNVCGRRIKMATGRAIANRRSEFTYTLPQLLKLRNSFLNLTEYTCLAMDIQPEIRRLRTIQNGIEMDYSQNSTHRFLYKSYLRVHDLRGVVFPHNHLRTLILRGNQIGPSLRGINFDRKLRVMDLSENLIEELDAKVLPRQLVRLVLSHNPIKGHLQDLPAYLEDLEVNGCKDLLSVEIVPYLRYLGISNSGIKHPNNLIVRGFIQRIEIMQMNVTELLDQPLAQQHWLSWAKQKRITLRHYRWRRPHG